jgi:hypothetical protein
MKQTILSVAFLVASSLAMHAQTSVQNNYAEQEVTMMVEQLKNAFMKSDVAFLEKYLADTYTFTDPGGKVNGKACLIDFIKGGNLKFESIIPDDRKVNVYENVAVITQHDTEKGHVGDEDISGEYRWMYILNKQGDDWEIVAMQGTRVMKSK